MALLSPHIRTSPLQMQPEKQNLQMVTSPRSLGTESPEAQNSQPEIQNLPLVMVQRIEAVLQREIERLMYQMYLIAQGQIEALDSAVNKAIQGGRDG